MKLKMMPLVLKSMKVKVGNISKERLIKNMLTNTNDEKFKNHLTKATVISSVRIKDIEKGIATIQYRVGGITQKQIRELI